jgi:hypothetical protein
MRQVTAIVAMLLFVLATTPGPALAVSPHFINTASVVGVNSDGSLSVSWKEAGLGDNVTVAYEFSGQAIADYGCVNRGGDHPQASNKETVQGPVSATGSFSSGKNGSINGTLTLDPPPPPPTFSCPGNQVLVLADITYSGLALVDTTNDVSATLNATSVSRTFFTF